MRFLMILTVGVCLLFTAMPAIAQSAADEAAIREVSKQAWATYNAKDLKAFMACWGESHEGWDGNIKGLAGLEKAIAKQFKQSKDGQLKIVEEIGVHTKLASFSIVGHALPPGERLNQGSGVF